jgi:hypothetical protein
MTGRRVITNKIRGAKDCETITKISNQDWRCISMGYFLSVEKFHQTSLITYFVNVTLNLLAIDDLS